MVRTQEPSEADKLDRIVRSAASDHGHKLVVTGWSRRTYDVVHEKAETRKTRLLLRVESFAIRSGEVVLFHPDGEACARQIAEALETTFDIEEALLIDRVTG